MQRNQKHIRKIIKVAIDCFDNIEEKKYRFLQFDIKEFYPSISESLLDRAIALVNYLDVSLNLYTGKYKLYRKPGNIPLYYISIEFDHPPIVT